MVMNLSSYIEIVDDEVSIAYREKGGTHIIQGN